MFSRLSPWSASPINSLANHSAGLSLFVAVLFYLIKGLDGHMPPSTKRQSTHVDWTLSLQLN